MSKPRQPNICFPARTPFSPFAFPCRHQLETKIGPFNLDNISDYVDCGTHVTVTLSHPIIAFHWVWVFQETLLLGSNTLINFFSIFRETFSFGITEYILIFTSFPYVPQLLGCAILGVGIWLRVDEESAKIIHQAPNVDMLYSLAYGLMAIGFLIMLIGFLGCCGAIRESQCMLAVVSMADYKINWIYH